jgi:hypothetical protein
VVLTVYGKRCADTVLATNAVVAINELELPNGGSGAVGKPVKAGLLILAFKFNPVLTSPFKLDIAVDILWV